MPSNLQLQKYNWFMLIAGFLIAILYSYGHLIDGDVIQNMNKAHAFVTQGKITAYGNISGSGMSGNVPGVFLTLIAALPMKIWFSPWAALAMIALLHFFSLLMMIDVLKNYLSPIGITALYVFFWLNPWRASEVFLWNPGYMYFVTALHMWSAYHLSKRPSFLYSFIHAQSLFIGLQVHASFVILFFITMMLLWTKALKAHWVGTVTGILFGILTLVPYILAGINDPSVFPQMGGGEGKGFVFYGLVMVYPLLKAFWYWILFGSTIFQTHVFHQLEYDWMNNEGLELVFKYFWLVLKYIVGVAGVLFSFFVNYQFYKKYKAQFKILKFKMTDSKQWLATYVILAFVSNIAATAISPTLPIYWHLLYVWPITIIPLLLFLDGALQSLDKGKLFRQALAFCAVYFIIFNTLAALGSRKHDIRSNFHQLYFEQCTDICVRTDQ